MATNYGQIASDVGKIALEFAAIEASAREFKSVVSTFRDFQAELVLTNAVAHGTQDQLNAMTGAARNFALSSKASINDVAQSLYFLASAGFTVQQSMSAMTAVIMLGQATMTDYNTAASLLSTSISAYGLAASDATRISNLFVASAHDSQATVSKLTFAMRMVAPVASTMGLSIEKTVAALDQLFNAGMSGEQAGTALRNVIMRITDPMGQGKLIFQNLGVDVIDQATGNYRDLYDILKDLSKLNLGTDALSMIGGRQSVAGLTTLLNSMKDLKTSTGETTTALDEHLKKIQGTNEAYRQAVAQMSTLDGAMARAKHSATELKLEIGEQLAPAIMSGANSFSDFAYKIKQTDFETKANFTSTIIAAAGFLTLIKTLSNVGPMMENMVSGYSKARVAATDMSIAVQAAATRTATVSESTIMASKGLGAMAAGIGEASMALLGTVGLVAALGALAVAFIKVADAKEKAKIDDFNKGFFTQYYTQNSSRLSQQGIDASTLKADNSHAGADLQRQTKDIANLYPVGQGPDGTLSGYAARAGAYQTTLTNIQDQININNEKIKAYTQLGASKKQLDEALQRLQSDVSGVGRFGQQTSALFGEQDVWLWQAKQNEGARQAMQTAMAKLAGTPVQDLKAASDENYANIVEAINQLKGVSSDKKQEMRTAAGNFITDLANSNSEVAKSMLDALPAAANLDDKDYWNKLRAEMQKRGVLSKAEIDKLINQTQEQNKLLQQTMSEATRRVAEDRPAIRQELKQAAMRAAQNNKQFADDLANVSKIDPSIWDKATDDIVKNFGDLNKGVDTLIARMKQLGLQSADHLKDQLSHGIIPMLDERIVQSTLAHAREQANRATLRGLEIGGKATVSQVRQAIFGANDDVFNQGTLQDIKTGFVEQITKGNEARRVAVQNNTTFLGGLDNLMSGAKRETQFTDDQIMSVLKPVVDQSVKPKNVVTLARAYIDQAFAARQNAQNEVNTYATRQGKTAATQQKRDLQILQRVLGIQSDSEFQDVISGLGIGNQFFVSADWLQQPLAVAQKELASATQKSKKDVDDAKKKFGAEFEQVFKGVFVGIKQEQLDALNRAFRGDGWSFGGKSYDAAAMAKVSATDPKLFKNIMDSIIADLKSHLPKGTSAGDVQALTTGATTLITRMVEEIPLVVQKGELAVTRASVNLKTVKAHVQEILDLQNWGFREGAMQDMLSALRKQPTMDALNQAINQHLDLTKLSVKMDAGGAKQRLREEFDKLVQQSFGIASIDDYVNNGRPDANSVGETLTKDQMRDLNDLINLYISAKAQIDVATNAQLAFWGSAAGKRQDMLNDFKANIDQMRLTSETQEGIGGQFVTGLRAGMMTLQHDMPTSFQTGINAMTMGVQGFASIFAQMALGMKVNFRQAAASILADVAKMIMEMLIMKAVMAVVGFASGGTAGAGTMAGASDVPMMAANGGVGTYKYALGGAHITRADLFGGGVKAPGQVTHAVFGEGMYPEAFVPMTDFKTVQVGMNQNGGMFIPLPSGKSIPVSMKKYASGGVSDDMLNGAGSMATGGGSGRKNSGNVAIHFGTTNMELHYHEGSGGNQTKDNEQFWNESSKKINALWDAREQQFLKKLHSQGGGATWNQGKIR